MTDHLSEDSVNEALFLCTPVHTMSDPKSPPCDNIDGHENMGELPTTTSTGTPAGNNNQSEPEAVSTAVTTPTSTPAVTSSGPASGISNATEVPISHSSAQEIPLASGNSDTPTGTDLQHVETAPGAGFTPILPNMSHSPSLPLNMIPSVGGEAFTPVSCVSTSTPGTVGQLPMFYFHPQYGLVAAPATNPNMSVPSTAQPALTPSNPPKPSRIPIPTVASTSTTHSSTASTSSTSLTLNTIDQGASNGKKSTYKRPSVDSDDVLVKAVDYIVDDTVSKRVTVGRCNVDFPYDACVTVGGSTEWIHSRITLLWFRSKLQAELQAGQVQLSVINDNMIRIFDVQANNYDIAGLRVLYDVDQLPNRLDLIYTQTDVPYIPEEENKALPSFQDLLQKQKRKRQQQDEDSACLLPPKDDLSIRRQLFGGQKRTHEDSEADGSQGVRRSPRGHASSKAARSTQEPHIPDNTKEAGTATTTTDEHNTSGAMSDSDLLAIADISRTPSKNVGTKKGDDIPSFLFTTGDVNAEAVQKLDNTSDMEKRRLLFDSKVKRLKTMLGRQVKVNELTVMKNNLLTYLNLRCQRIAERGSETFFWCVGRLVPDIPKMEPSELASHMRKKLSHFMAVNRNTFVEAFVENHKPDKNSSFYAYLAQIDPPGHRMDYVLPMLMSMLLERKITIFAGKDIWHSDDECSSDIVLAYVNGTFIPTDVAGHPSEEGIDPGTLVTIPVNFASSLTPDHFQPVHIDVSYVAPQRCSTPLSPVIDWPSVNLSPVRHFTSDLETASKASDCSSLALDSLSNTPLSSPTKRFKCHKHKIGFVDIEDFKEHNLAEHSAKHHCEMCGKGYATKYSLEHHLNTIHLGLPYHCDAKDCDSSFTSYRAKENHMKMHVDRNVDFVCKVCNESFGTTTALKTHSTVHTNKKYACDWCNRYFSRTSDVTRHQKGFCKYRQEASDETEDISVVDTNQSNGNRKTRTAQRQGGTGGEKNANTVTTRKTSLRLSGSVMSSSNAASNASPGSKASSTASSAPVSKGSKRNKKSVKAEMREIIEEQDLLRYTCALCHKKYATGPLCVSHMQTAHRKTSLYTCGTCYFTFCSSTMYLDHQKGSECRDPLPSKM